MTKRWALAVGLLLAGSFINLSCDSGGGGKKSANDGGGGGDGDQPGDGDKPTKDGGTSGDGDMTGMDGGPVGDGDSSVPPGPTGSISGYVFSTGNPPVGLEGVRISGPGNKTTTTLADGSFSLDDLPVSKNVALIATHDNHSTGLRMVGVLKDRVTFAEFYVGEVVTASFDVQKGGGVKGTKGEGATYPADSLVTKDGMAAEGEVTVTVATIDPTKSSNAKSFPGHAEAADESGKKGQVDSYSPMEVRVADGSGKQLKLKDGKTAQYDFPVSLNIPDVPDEIDLWSLDEDLGIWKHEGKAKKKRDENGNVVYTATVSHMSWWNCGTFDDAVTCVRGCVKNGKGDPAAGAAVNITGKSYLLSDTEVAGDDGCFAVDVKQDSDVEVFAATVGEVSSIKVQHTDMAAKHAADDPSKCQDLGIIDLGERPAGGCPAGYTMCTIGQTPTCIDLQNDPNHCGATCEGASVCGGEVNGSGPYDSVCVAGTCQCAPGWTDCDGYCRNTNNDSNWCGACNVSCNTEANEVCNNGKCVTLTCDTPEIVCNVNRGPVCANTTSSAANCGECGTVCGQHSSEPVAHSACVNSLCGCQDNYTKCEEDGASYYECFDTQTDPLNCGGCGGFDQTKRCNSDNQTCKAGVCTDIDCGATPKAACDGTCTDTSTDANNCGKCHSSCLTEGHAGYICKDSTCQCPQNTIDCNDGRGCIDPQTDDNHCGGCGGDAGPPIQCAGNQKCAGGQCATLPCLQGQAACNHTCTDILSNNGNCGGCGINCPSEGFGQCVNGACTCTDVNQEICGPVGSQYCIAKGMCPVTADAGP